MEIVERRSTVRDHGDHRVRVMYACAVLSFAGALILLLPQHGHLLDWDEVDYAAAADMGIVGNMLDHGSLSPRQSLQLVRAKLAGRPHLAPPSYDERADAFVLRHYHPPAVPMLMAALPTSRAERSVRTVQLFGLAALVAIVMVAYVRTSANPTTAGFLCLGSGLVWLGWQLFRSVHFHGWEGVWVIAVGLSLLEWTRRERRRWAVALCGSLAMAILTLESGVILVALVALYIAYRAHRGGRPAARVGLQRTLLVGLGLVFSLVVAGWPALISKADLVRTPTYLLSLIPGGTFGSTEAGAGSWAVRVPLLMGAAAVFYLLRSKRGEIDDWGPWAALSLYSLPLMAVAVAPQYVLAGLIPLFILGAYVLDTVPRRPRAWLAGGLIVLIGIGLGGIVRENRRTGDADRLVRADMSFLGSKLEGVPSLLDGGHVFRRYLNNPAIQDLWFSDDFSSLGVRHRGKFHALQPDEVAGRYVGVLRQREGFLRSGAGQDLQAQCPVIVRPTVWIFDCTTLAEGTGLRPS